MNRLRAGWRVVGALLGAALVASLVSGYPRSARGASNPDPEPTVNMDIKYDIDPGPGWPAGYTPPAPPKELSQAIVDQFELERSRSNDPSTPQRIAMRVMPFLPDWTKQYPYVWHLTFFQCGLTEYVYYFPYPDRELLQKVYGDGYQTMQGFSGGPQCLFSPISLIKPANSTPEQRETAKMEAHLDNDIHYARLGGTPAGALDDCVSEISGTPDKIYVCFNAGDASKRFDAPAFLDASVGRVRVPVRFVSEMMGADVQWDGAAQSVTIHFPAVTREIAWPVSLPGYKPSDWIDPEQFSWNPHRYQLALQNVTQPERTIVLTVGQNVALVDGHEVTLDAPPVIVPPGRTMVPVRFIAEAMGAKVYWVGKQPIWPGWNGALAGTYQVHIYTPFFPFFDYPSWFLETRAQRF